MSQTTEIRLPIRLYTDVDHLLPFCEAHEIWLLDIDPLQSTDHHVLLVLNHDVSFDHVPSHQVQIHLGRRPVSSASDSQSCMTQGVDGLNLPGAVLLSSTECTYGDDDDVGDATVSSSTDTPRATFSRGRLAFRFECLTDVAVFLKGTFEPWQTYWKVKMSKKVRKSSNKTALLDYLAPLHTVWPSLLKQRRSGGDPVASQWLQNLLSLPTLMVPRADVMARTQSKLGVEYRNILHGALYQSCADASTSHDTSQVCFAGDSITSLTTTTAAAAAAAASASSLPRRTVHLHKLPVQHWTDLTLSVFFERADRDWTIEPTLCKISHFQRAGAGRNFKFLCHWNNGAQTWQKLVHLLPNPTYKEYLKRGGWDIEIECRLDLDCAVDIDELSDGAAEDLREYQEHEANRLREKNEDAAEAAAFDIFAYKKISKRKASGPSAGATAGATATPAVAATPTSVHMTGTKRPRSIKKATKTSAGYPVRVFRNSTLRFNHIRN